MPKLGRALEEGVWPDVEPPARALLHDGGLPQPDRVRIRAWAEVAASYLITGPRAVDALRRTTSGPPTTPRSASSGSAVIRCT